MHPLRVQKERKRRRRRLCKSGDATGDEAEAIDSEAETDDEGEEERGTSTEIKQGIMRRLEHLDSEGNYR